MTHSDNNIILLVAINAIATYVALFTNHHIFIKTCLAIISLACMKELYPFLKKFKNIDKFTFAEKYQQINNNILDNEHYAWLSKNEELWNICIELSIINKYYVKLVEYIKDQLNIFLRTYYKAIVKTDLNLYRNLEKHKHVVQKLEDIKVDVDERLHDVIYLITYKKYAHHYNISDKKSRINKILALKINLLKHKRKLD